MDNSIGAMFMTILREAMSPLVERIETLEHDLGAQDKLVEKLEAQLEEKAKAQTFDTTPAGVMNLFVEALNNGAGNYREFVQYIDATVDASQTIKDMKEQLPGDASDQADLLFNSRHFTAKLVDWADYRGYMTNDEVKEMITEESSSVDEDQVREWANEEIDSREFLDEEKLTEKLENLSITVSVN